MEQQVTPVDLTDRMRTRKHALFKRTYLRHGRPVVVAENGLQNAPQVLVLLAEGAHLPDPLLERWVLPVQGLEERCPRGGAEHAGPGRASPLAVLREEGGEGLVLLVWFGLVWFGLVC